MESELSILEYENLHYETNIGNYIIRKDSIHKIVGRTKKAIITWITPLAFVNFNHYYESENKKSISIQLPKNENNCGRISFKDFMKIPLSQIKSENTFIQNKTYIFKYNNSSYPFFRYCDAYDSGKTYYEMELLKYLSNYNNDITKIESYKFIYITKLFDINNFHKLDDKNKPLSIIEFTQLYKFMVNWYITKTPTDQIINKVYSYYCKLFEYKIIICPICRCDNTHKINDIKENTKTDDECCICLINKVNFKFNNCNHSVICLECCNNL